MFNSQTISVVNKGGYNLITTFSVYEKYGVAVEIPRSLLMLIAEVEKTRDKLGQMVM